MKLGTYSLTPFVQSGFYSGRWKTRALLIVFGVPILIIGSIVLLDSLESNKSSSVAVGLLFLAGSLLSFRKTLFIQGSHICVRWSVWGILVFSKKLNISEFNRIEVCQDSSASLATESGSSISYYYTVVFRGEPVHKSYDVGEFLSVLCNSDVRKRTELKKQVDEISMITGLPVEYDGFFLVGVC